MYHQSLHIQAPTEGAFGAILEGLSELRSASDLQHFYAAVAYATLGGCELLAKQLRDERWTASEKKWLIGIDFGHTEPSALRYLSALPSSTVRVPNGIEVALRTGFSPRVVFHPKIYFAGRLKGPRRFIAAAFMGSANLTVSGLLAGTEVGVLQKWASPVRPSERQAMQGTWAALHWFDRAWLSADPLTRLLTEYEARWAARPQQENEDGADTPTVFRGDESVIAGVSALRVGSACGFWVETGTLYRNRGASRAGNQLDLPRGSRVFFGFPSREVPRNQIFGELVLQCEGFEPVRRTMRFGNNMMDKLNLPIPGGDGPETYDNRVLLFLRRGRDAQGRSVFLIRVGTEEHLARWRGAAKMGHEEEMHGGRRWGLLF
jgi:HKD family nuclease